MNARRSWDMTKTYYPAIRLSMDDRREQLDDQQLEDYLAEIMPGVDPEEVENFMRSLQRFGRQVAPIAQRALPGIIQGATQGGMVGGPWGALGGAVIGGVSSALSGRGRQPQPSPSPPAPTAAPTPVAARITPGPVSAGTTAGSPAANVSMNMTPIQQLMALLSRPETMQALSALLMSGAGRRTVNLGGQSVPAASFANAISEIAADVVDASYSTIEENIADYLVDSQGMPRGDINNPSERARLLLGEISLQATQEFYEDLHEDNEQESSDYGEEDLEDEPDEGWDGQERFSEDDAIDGYEQALQGGSYI